MKLQRRICIIFLLRKKHNSCCMFNLIILSFVNIFPDKKENIDTLNSLLILFQFDGQVAF
ncbi:uncharacterized protein Smp_202640 [Schistosoma mansoni]|uniref:uncharacterized protein n=1 Tax=Schistosoma mansoni TaxID=6183 RepID=UPI00022DC77D|nr:uncharacterized protein Smp_202640 [Schistosoma mansoni]|eukprot:XP_018651855.1 uncharacterized protein Smp_202640 [Schistosoma mansoni]